MRRVVFLALFLLFGCDTDEAEFPVLVTAEAQQIGTTSVVLEANFKEIGTFRPVRFGFIWGKAPELNIFNAPEKLDLGETSGVRKFSIKLEMLAPASIYYVRSYAALPDYSKIYYGNEIIFSTLN